MKKLWATLACGIVLATTASADLLRAEIGAGMWMQSPSGEPNKTNLAIKSDETEKAQPYVWAYFKHPVPVIPNLRVEYVTAQSGAVTSGVATNLDVTYTQMDFVPYYNILDNTFWMTVDVGLDVKVLNAKEETTATKTDSVVLPLGYVRARVQAPATNFGVEADVKYISVDNNTVYDARAKVDYTLDFIPVLQPAIEVGYRMQKFETKELLGRKMDMTFAGVYAGLMVRF